MNWVLEGRVWLVGDDVGHDSHIMSLSVSVARISDPAVLAGRIFEESFPDITAGAEPGDIIVAGRRFSHGNPHLLGWVGMRGRGVGVVCTSITRGGIRNAVSAGGLVLAGDTALPTVARTGQGIRVDFDSGLVELDSGERYDYEPLPPLLRQIISLGGTLEWTRHQLSEARANKSASTPS